MNKIILFICLILSSTAYAGEPYGYYDSYESYQLDQIQNQQLQDSIQRQMDENNRESEKPSWVEKRDAEFDQWMRDQHEKKVHEEESNDRYRSLEIQRQILEELKKQNRSGE